MSGILRLESLTKGNTLRQGDKTPLKYRLFDADGEKLNIAGKSAKVRLVYPDFLTIGYEKDGLTVAQDDTVTFTIDNVIPSRIYHVEIIVDGQFIFPSRADESKFTVDKSSLGTEANIIEIVGIDAVASKVIERIGNDIGEVVNAEEVAGAIERDNLLDGKVIPKDESVTNKKLASGSTTLSKINIDGYLPKSLVYKNEGSHSRLHSVVYLRVGDIIKLNGDFQVSITKIEEPTHSYLEGSEGRRTWEYNDWTVPEESWYYIRVRFESNADIIGDALDNLMNRGVVILTSDTAVTKKELNDALSDLPAEVAPQKLSQSGDVITLSGDGGTINLSNKQDKLTDGSITTGKLANNSVTVRKAEFINTSNNLFNKDTALDGYGLVSSTGELVSSSVSTTSDFIPVEPSTTVYKNHIGALQEYDVNKNRINGYGGGHGARSYDLTDNTYYVRVAMNTESKDVYQLEYGTEGTEYQEYGTKLSPEIQIDIDNLGQAGVSEIQTRVVEGLSGFKPMILEHGGVDGSSMDKDGVDSTTRARMQETPFVMKAGDKIELTDTDNYEMALATEITNAYINGWNTTSYSAESEVKVVFMIRRKDGAVIDLLDLEKSITYQTTDRIAMVKDLQNTIPQGKIIRYVTLDGSDDNSGESHLSGYATLQKAIDDKANTIYIQAGKYLHQSVNANIDELEISVFDVSEGNEQAIFSGADTLSDWVESDGVYRTPYTGNDRFDQVFISKTLPIETTSNRPTYNAVLWEGNNLEDDYKMKPVLTLAECQAETGTFYYDGEYVYANPNSVDSEFNAVLTSYGLRLTGNKLKMTGVVFDFYTGNPMGINDFGSIDILKSGANHSSSQDGWNLNGSFGRLILCTGAKNRNDGFNNHYTGELILENCFGINNYDDGASPHEACTMTLMGGEYRGNGKGGISPASRARAYVYNAKLIGNRFGFYNSLAGYGSVSSGNLIKDNEYAYLNTAEGFISINDVLVGNGNLFSGNDFERYPQSD